ncbi:hypothetical protein L1887_27330 [Cichorium endivia]|nr:hypothetical protein L1887_27330 [Cichorium endivia]
MTPRLPNPFKPSRLNILSKLVTKVTALLNHNLSVKQLKQLHALVLINGLNHLEPLVITQINFTQSDNSEATIHYLRSLLRQSKHPNAIARTSAIQFFYQRGEFQEALVEYVNMQKTGLFPTTSTVASALKACTRLRNWIGGITIHAQVHGYGFCGDIHVGTALVGFYSKLDDMETAKKVFDEMSERNSASCLINGYLESGNFSMVERLSSEMGNTDITSWDSMVSFYTRTGDMEKAIALFGAMPVKTSSSWMSMISGYINSNKLEFARNFYDVMPEQNLISCIKLIEGYSKNRDVESAREIFNEIGEKNHLLYNAMITCYFQNNRPKDALHLFDEMLQPNVNIQPDNTTLAIVISVCSQLGDLRYGSWIDETLMKEMKIKIDDHLCSALIEFYAKFGRVDKALGLFHGLKNKDVGVYTTMILACGRYGWKYDAIKLFEEMLEANICPNLVTFSGVLNVLNHGGMVEESYHGFS